MQTKERKQVESLTRIYTVIVFVVIGVLIAKLAWMQLVETDFYTSRADAQRNRLMTISATRGDIITSDGTVLVTDRPSYQLTVDYLSLRTDGAYNEETINLLVSLLEDPELTADKIKEICDANSGYLYKPIVLKKNLDIAAVSRIEAHREQLPGVSVESTPERTYLQGCLGRHVLGYIGDVSQSELDAQVSDESSDEAQVTY